MKESVVIYREKSEESLNSATICFENRYYNSTVKRAYYGMFQIAAALLFKHGITPKSKKIGHDWLQSEFSKLFINRSTRFPRFKNFLNEIQRLRETADYSPDKVSREKASRTLEKAKIFIYQLEKAVSGDV